MSVPEVLLHRDQGVLAEAAAARLITRIADAQAARGTASVVLTGGGVGTAVLAALGGGAARDAVDWGRLDVWWGDERFLPAGDPERNETGAREALLDRVPLDPARVHPMPAADGPDGADPEAAASRYADELLFAAHPGAAPRSAFAVPSFDVLMLGVGPDAHVASLFPGMPEVAETRRPAVAVHDAPKPPPTRISLTFPVLRAAREVWVLAAGDSKAEAVRLGLSGADPVKAPVAAARGRERTLFLLDEAAASHLPAGPSPAR
ncbi:6-phosphogluconolactonase [Actinomadura livida]|uniref:6-phosphogluconolactonase n=1 Tax=Actinomadura livida TaxID=79909 RepID=A0A7W7IEE2_9ACTN|nr:MULTISPECIES: 6-phosphogluconolactonase [Actinomadura]MBB4775569.1 6-phosphogluconolactonase [Actinomadura catellatispora]GGT91271.1 6-phosphogluconolactonase [Actinomadura livida]